MDSKAIRDRCNIAAGEATPIHLLNLNWSKVGLMDGCGTSLL